MRLISVLLILSFLQVSAAGFAQKITLKRSNAALTDVLKDIRHQSGYSVVMSTRLMDRAIPVTINLENVNLSTALAEIFSQQQLTFSVSGKRITVLAKPASSIAPPVRIRVVDSLGQPIAGVSVRLKGTRTLGITDGDGLLNAELNTGDVLVFSFIGFQSAEHSVSGTAPMTITLKPLVTALKEVDVIINTGYQSIAKERSAGAFAKPDMDIVRNRSTSMNVLQRLDGLVPGLTINNAPGAAANPLLIRGLTTIGVSEPGSAGYQGAGTNRSPLFVVDGIQLDDVSSINPQDVADITVLKDATAASIWGSRASNGVIVITTKKGNSNEKLKITYDGFFNMQRRPDLDYYPVLSSQEFIQSFRSVFDRPGTAADPSYGSLYPWNVISGFTNLGSAGVAPHEVIAYNALRGLITRDQANHSLDSLAAINNLSQIRDVWYRDASVMNHTLSLSGGSKVYSFYGSLAFTDTKSNRPGDENKNYKINLRQDFNIHPSIRAYLITDLTNSLSKAKRNINIESSFYPYQLFRDAAGNNLSMPYMTSLSDSTRMSMEARSRIGLNYIPLDEYNYGYTNNDGLLARITSGISVNLLKNVKFEGVYGFVKGIAKTRMYDDSKSYLVRSELVQFTVAPTPASNPQYYLPTSGGRYTVSNQSQRNWTVRNQLTYNNNWDNAHQLTLLAGQEAQEQRTVTERSTARGYNEGLQTVGLVDYAMLANTGVAGPVLPNSSSRSILANNISTAFFGESESLSRFTSYYANAAYTYLGKYALNASWRIDQSNLFGKDRSAQNRPVWSTGVKWTIGRESFIQENIAWIDDLALRGTFGITGVSPAPGTAASYNIMQPETNGFLYGGSGLGVAAPANRKLTWESTRTINLGIDFSVWSNRINGAVDLYQKKTSDLLGNFEVNGFSGYNIVTGNLGDMKNQGIEAVINTRNLERGTFNWSSSLVMAYNKNRVTNLRTPTPVSTGAQKISSYYLPGYTAFALFAYDYAGLDAMGDPQIRLADKTVTKANNVATASDVVFMGTYQPVWSGGIGNTFRYKGLSLSANAVYNLGHVMRRDVNTFYGGRFTHNNVTNSSGVAAPYLPFRGNIHSDFLMRWQQPGDEARTNIPGYVTNSSLSTSRRTTSYYTNGDLNVVSASYIKLRDISLSYDLPAAFVERLKAQNIGFRLQASNIMLWKANKYDIDPEFHNAATGVRSLPVNQVSVTIGAHLVF